MVKKVRKRDGSVVFFQEDKIEDAIWKAVKAVGGKDREKVRALTNLIIEKLAEKSGEHGIPDVEEVQNLTEKILIEEGHAKVAKAFILYRKSHEELRNVKGLFDTIEVVDDYIGLNDWMVKENSNMGYSLQGLNNYITTKIIANYWMRRVYPEAIRLAHESQDIHIHDLDSLGAYCVGWDLKDLLTVGFKGVKGKVESKPPKHLRTALGQMVNFFYTLQGETAGAQAFSNFDTLLAPFVKYDNLNYKQVKQSMQEFVFNLAVPTRVGFQTPFTNITMDLDIPSYMANEHVIIGGQPQIETYKDFEKEMGMINKAFAEVMIEGDATGQVFTFPIPTYNITKDFDFDKPEYELIWEMTAKYGIPYFSNFVNSDMKPEDSRSMCCRLRIDNTQLKKRGGGLFGANPQTGSIGVVTVNMARLGFVSINEDDFISRLSNLMELAKESLEIKRKAVENFTKIGLYPYSKFYLRQVNQRFGEYWKNHFATIGLLGMNEAIVNFMPGENITTEKGRTFSLRILDFMRDKLSEYQEETGNIYNLEATPGEGTTYRFARSDKKRFGKAIVANEEAYQKGAAPYYTNSSQLPVGFTEDVFEALDLQDELQCKYTGGCVEKGNKVLTNKGLMKIENIVRDFERLKPLKVLSYNNIEGVSEWDEVSDAMKIDVKKHDKIRVLGEGNLDIVTSDWHPFFVMEKIEIKNFCPICEKRVNGVRGFAGHLKFSKECRDEYNNLNKYRVVEKRADELKKGDYILQNSFNLYTNKKTKLDSDLMWLIGFFIGDGCISKFRDNRGGNNIEKHSVRFFSSNIKVLDKVALILNERFGAEVSVIKNDKRSVVLREVGSSRKKVLDFFFKIGFVAGKKVYNVSVPEFVKSNLSESNVFGFLSGLMDSDGHIGKRDGDLEYSTVSSNLADDLLEIFSIAGINISKYSKISCRENEKMAYRLRIPQYYLTSIRNKLSANVNLLNIKNVVSERAKRHLPVVRVKECNKVNVEDNMFYDLTVKNNHNYLAGKDCLVFVHNTVFHTFVGEKMTIDSVKRMVKKISNNYHLPYFTISPTFSICPIHGYLSGEHEYCPKCDAEIAAAENSPSVAEDVIEAEEKERKISQAEGLDIKIDSKLNFRGDGDGTNKM